MLRQRRLKLPTTTYRNNRHSAISQASDINGGDGRAFSYPLLWIQAQRPVDPRSTSETFADPTKKSKENKAPEKDYFGISKTNGRNDGQSRGMQVLRPLPTLRSRRKVDNLRQKNVADQGEYSQSTVRRQASSTKASPASEMMIPEYNTASPSNANGKNQSPGEKFRLERFQRERGLPTRGATLNQRSAKQHFTIYVWKWIE